MRRRRRKPLGTGYAILRHDDGTWYAGGDAVKLFWRDRIRESAIYDAEATAAAIIDDKLSIRVPDVIFEIVPVNREAVFGG